MVRISQVQVPHSLGEQFEVPPLQDPMVWVREVNVVEGQKGHRVTMEVKCGMHGVLEADLVFSSNANTDNGSVKDR